MIWSLPQTLKIPSTCLKVPVPSLPCYLCKESVAKVMVAPSSRLEEGEGVENNLGYRARNGPLHLDKVYHL